MRTLTFSVLAVSVLVVSTSSLLIRVAQAEQVSSLSIAFWRLALASTLLWLFFGSQRHFRAAVGATSRQSFALMFSAGAFLALHFASWIASLAYTSVASSTALVSTNSVWLLIFAWLVSKEKPNPWIGFSVATSLVGSAIIFMIDASPDSRPGSNNALGNALAISGSIAVCGYLLIGRRLAALVSTPVYITVVFSSAAVCTLVIALVNRVPLCGYSATVWLALAGLAVGPQLLGHGGISWSLRYLTPTTVSIAILGEPVCSAVLALWILDEEVTPAKALGFALIMIGIYVATRQGPAAKKIPTA
jgi:drug/metabolite transporter (DMT)-like permease